MSFHLKINEKISGPFDASQVEQILKMKIPGTFFSEDGGQTWEDPETFGKEADQILDPTDEQLAKAGNQPNVPPIKASQLKRCLLFSDMSEEQIEHFTTALRQFKVKAYYPIIKAGAKASSLFILVSGEARISVRPEGKEELLKVIESGHFVGEVALFDGGTRSADVIANTDCLVLRITREDLNKIISENPAVATPFLFNLGKFLAARLRETNERFLKAKNFAQSITS